MNCYLRTLATLILFVLVSSCGQSGPLYIPGNPSEVQVPPNTEQEDDDEKNEDSTDEPETQ